MYRNVPKFTKGQEMGTVYWWCITQLLAAAAQDVLLIIYASLHDTNDGTKCFMDYCQENYKSGVTKDIICDGYDRTLLTSNPRDVAFDLQLTRRLMDRVLGERLKVSWEQKDVLDKIRKRLRWLVMQRNEICHDMLTSLDASKLKTNLSRLKGILRQIYNFAGKFTGRDEETNKALDPFLNEIQSHHNLASRWDKYGHNDICESSDSDDEDVKVSDEIDSPEEAERSGNSVNYWDLLITGDDTEGQKEEEGAIEADDIVSNIYSFDDNETDEEKIIIQKVYHNFRDKGETKEKDKDEQTLQNVDKREDKQDSSNMDTGKLTLKGKPNSKTLDMDMLSAYRCEEVEQLQPQAEESVNCPMVDAAPENYQNGLFHEVWGARSSTLIVQLGLYCSRDSSGAAQSARPQFDTITSLLPRGHKLTIFCQRCRCSARRKHVELLNKISSKSGGAKKNSEKRGSMMKKRKLFQLPLRQCPKGKRFGLKKHREKTKKMLTQVLGKIKKLRNLGKNDNPKPPNENANRYEGQTEITTSLESNEDPDFLPEIISKCDTTGKSNSRRSSVKECCHDLLLRYERNPSGRNKMTDNWKDADNDNISVCDKEVQYEKEKRNRNSSTSDESTSTCEVKKRRNKKLCGRNKSEIRMEFPQPLEDDKTSSLPLGHLSTLPSACTFLTYTFFIAALSACLITSLLIFGTVIFSVLSRAASDIIGFCLVICFVIVIGFIDVIVAFLVRLVLVVIIAVVRMARIGLLCVRYLTDKETRALLVLSRLHTEFSHLPQKHEPSLSTDS